MRETFWYFEYTAEQLEEIAEQARLAQGGVSIQYEDPPPYDGQILEYDDGGTDGSRLTNPTPIDQTPTDAGYADIDLVIGVLNDNGSEILNAESGILRIEQHPSMYGLPLRIKFTCQLSNGSQPANNNIIVSTPTVWQNSLYIEVGLILSPESTITQESLVQALDSITYGGNYVMITSIHANSTSPLVAFSNLESYNNSGEVFQNLCTNPYTVITTAGNPNAQLQSGFPHIEGIFEQGRLLSVSLIDITDRDTVFPYGFQWYREESTGGTYNNVAIDGATSILYTVSSADVGKNLTVAVTYINNAGDATQKNSPPAYINNSLPSADISISAESFRVGNFIDAEVSNVRDRNTVKSISNYRWQQSNVVPLVSSDSWTADWTDIQDSNLLTYEITSANQGRRLRFAVDITDQLDDVRTLTSDSSQVVNTSPQGTLEITGVPSVGSSIYAVKNFTTPDVYDWAYKQRTYTWYRNGIEIPTSVKTGNNWTENLTRYIVQSEDFGNQISVSITYTDDRGYDETITSTAVSVVGSTASGLAIGGINEVSGTVRADFTDFIDPDITSEDFYVDQNGQTQTIEIGKPNPTEVLYRWRIAEDDLFITPEGNQYDSILISGSYYGKTIELSVKYPDPLNEGVYKTSTAQETVVNSSPTGQIEITGSIIGIRLPLTLSVDQISDINGPYGSENDDWDFNYSLSVRQRNAFGNLQNATEILNASGVMKGNQTVQYTVAPEYQNSIIIATVTYTDGEGVEHELTDSVEIPQVTYPTLQGTFEAGQDISVDVSEIENLVSIDSIKWYLYNNSTFEEIAGATSTTYSVIPSDVEKHIVAEVTYTTDSSDTETRSTVPVLIGNSDPVGIPRLENSGSFYAQGFAVGDTLSSSVEHITDINGVDYFYDYQWYVQKNGHAFTIPDYQEDRTNVIDIQGETNPTYTIKEQDQLKRIGYKVKLVDNLGKVHQLNTGLSWRRVDYQPTGYIRVKRNSDSNTTSCGINDILGVDYSQYIELDGISQTRNHVWKADGNIVQQGTNGNYLVKPEDYQKQISVEITYSDITNGDVKNVLSTNVFSVSQTAASGLYINGEPIAGSTLVGNTALIEDADGIPPEEQMQFQWYRDNTLIEGQTTKSYTVLRSDYNKILKLAVQYTDGQNNQENLEASVLIGDSEPNGFIEFSGQTSVGSVLTIDVSNITDAYGPETQSEKEATLYSYAMIAIDGDGVQTTLSQGDVYGNQTATYTITQSDLGKSISITGTYIDGKGVQKELESIYVDENGVQQGSSLYIPYSPDLAPQPEVDDEGNLASISLYEGPIEATGAGLKTVKLISNEYIITYDSSGYNPDIANFIITATAYNHIEPIYYKFYLLTSDSSDIFIPKGPNDTTTTRKIITNYQYISSLTYRVDTIEGTEDGDIIATDLVTIYGIKE